MKQLFFLLFLVAGLVGINTYYKIRTVSHEDKIHGFVERKGKKQPFSR